MLDAALLGVGLADPVPRNVTSINRAMVHSKPATIQWLQMIEPDVPSGI